MSDDELFEYLSTSADLPFVEDDPVGITTTGPNCIKCDWRNDAQLWEGSSFIFSKVICEAFTVGQTPRVIPERLLRHYLGVNDFSEEHTSHVNHVHTPGLVVMGFDDQQRVFTFLIDGTHRAAASLRCGREFRAYVLNPRDTAVASRITTELSNTNFFWVDPSLRVSPQSRS